MKIVIDTNVFISGLHWNGLPRKVLRFWQDGKFELVSSLSIIQELTRVLMGFKVPMPPEDIAWWEEFILQKAVIVIPKQKLNVVKDDPDDDKFIEAAVEGSAEYIVSKDNHLLKLKTYKKIKIVTPEEFLKEQENNI